MTGPIRVLAVGDSGTARPTATALADREERFAVESTTDRATALDRIEAGSFDCVVVAVDGPAGVDVVAAVRDATSDLPCLLYADAEAESVVEDAFAAGANDYVRRFGAGQATVLAHRVREHVDSGRDRETLRKHSRLLEQLFEQVPIYLYVKDTEGRFRWVSDFYDDAPSDAVGKTDRELFPQAGEKTYRDDMRVIETGEALLNEEEYVPSTDHYNLTSKVPWYGRDGEIQGLIGVTRDISELNEYRERLERQNRRLEEFASIVSHDLRNPLQVVRARLEMLDGDREADHLAVAIDAADRMTEIIDDTLTLARQGDAVGEFDRVELGAVVDRCWGAIETDPARLELADPPVVSADRSRLRTLLENLLANAVEHTHGPTTVTIGGLPDGFYVADDGIGIPVDERDAVFAVSHTGAEEGTGLGLTIAEEVATAHGWDVELTESESGGARFEVTGVETLEPADPSASLAESDPGR
jgi:signal transduction histidine kinase